MESIKKMLRRGGLVSIMESLVFGIIGFILYIKAEAATVVATTIIGIALIIFGICKMLVYWGTKEDGYEDENAINYEYVYGIMAIIIGVIVIRYNAALESLFRILMGVWILYTSLIKFALTLKMKSRDIEAWVVSMALSVLMFFFGLFIVFNAGIIIKTVGIFMMIYAIVDIIEDILCIIKINEVF